MKKWALQSRKTGKYYTGGAFVRDGQNALLFDTEEGAARELHLLGRVTENMQVCFVEADDFDAVVADYIQEVKQHGLPLDGGEEGLIRALTYVLKRLRTLGSGDA